MTGQDELTDLRRRLDIAEQALRLAEDAATERTRAETAMRESEQRFAQFAASSTDGLWVRDAATLTMEYVSPAIGTIYGTKPDALLGDVAKWMDLILPEDRGTARHHLEEPRGGATVVHEFRIQSDRGTRWIRNTDFPLFNAEGAVQRIGGIARDVTEEKRAADHKGFLLFELQHRVRNVLALTRSIVTRSGADDGILDNFVSHLVGRLDAIARTQSLLTRVPDPVINLESILREELLAQAAADEQVSIAGPEVELAAKSAEVLTLAIHELATNSIKYGALSEAKGSVAVSWAVEQRGGEDWLRFSWKEAGVHVLAPAPRPRGFGTELIERRVPYELRGRGLLSFGPGGIECTIAFPMAQGVSILQTDLPLLETEG